MRMLPQVLAALCACASPMTHSSRAATTFPRAFSPSEGALSAPEKPLRQELCLNGAWQFQPVGVPQGFVRGSGTPPELKAPEASKWEATPLKVPSPWNVNTWGNGRDVGEGTARPYAADSVYFPSYPASWDGAEMGWLRRRFRVPSAWGARRVILRFEGVAGEAQVLVNGKSAGGHFDSFLPFELDITPLVRGGENELLVGVRKSELFNKISDGYPSGQQRTYPNGSNMDSLAGIWGDVFLLGLPAVRVEDAFVKPLVSQQVLEAELTLRNDTSQPRSVRIAGEIQPWVNLAGKDALSAPEPKSRLGEAVQKIAPRSVTVPARGSAKVTLRQDVGAKLRFWTPSTPNLYGLTLQVLEGAPGSARAVDSHFTRFGWREWTISGRDLLLNGRKIQLVGDLLHPFGPFVGSRRHAWAFYRMIKDVGGNAVRPHAQPHPRHFLELADEMGICVLDEAAIFGSSINLNLKEPATWRRLGAHIDGLVRRDRNHPSVFGWSTGNEMFALFFKSTPEERAASMAKLQVLAVRPRALDTTRQWISVDGDEDLGGALPVWSRHFGIGTGDLPNVNKPLMVGEQGGTYYAAPPLLAPLVGERAYESYEGRNEALAADVSRFITDVARPKLAYFSPSELAWFGIEQLPLGYADFSRLPTRADGIFFGAFREGVPGIQPERIPPYAMTFNPGLDASLPLYKPLPMFRAMKAALAGQKLPASPWGAPEPKRSHPAPSQKFPKAAFIGDRRGALFASLFAMGVPFAEENDASPDFAFVDGEALSEAQVQAARVVVPQVLARGGRAWVLIRESGAALPRLRDVLGGEVQATTRRASSLVRGAEDARVAGFGLGDLYFAGEDGDQYIQKAGLGGGLVSAGRVILRASETDWALFERKGEVEKNGAVLLYEALQKPSGAALVESERGAGRLWISSLDYKPGTKAFRAFWRQLLSNAGLAMGAPPATALVASSREGEGTEWRYTTQEPAADWATPGFDDAVWKLGRAGFGSDVPNGRPRTPWSTGDIWLRREFSLQELPSSLALEIHHDEDVEVFLNGVRVFAERGHLSDYKEVPLGPEALAALRKGRNVLAAHCRQTAGGQFLDLGLSRSASLPGARPHDLLLDGPLTQ